VLNKAEVIQQRGPWKNFDAVEFATLEWVDWSNHRRLLESIGHIPHAEAEARCNPGMEQSALAAWLKLNSPRQTRYASNRDTNALADHC
jgi:hypothetical protein